jgi:predicted MPP superfamily phosphohydrolase
MRTPSSPVVVAAVAGIAGSLLAYAHLVEPRRLTVERWLVRVPNLPDAWEGMRVVHLTDFQIGMWLQSRALAERSVKLALALRPDAVFLTGDFMHTGRWSSEGEIFAPLAACAPTFAVLGNHDYLSSESDALTIAARLRAQSVCVLINEHTSLEWRGESRTIVGIDDFATEHTDLVKAVTGIAPGTEILALLSHVPDAAAALPSGWFPLTVAGHTHGAQIRISPLERYSWIRLSGHSTYSKFPRGWFDVGGLLYVNRGIGLSNLPLRFAAPPEVALLVLTDGRALREGRRWARWRGH